MIILTKRWMGYKARIQLWQGSLTKPQASARINSAARWATASVGALVFAEVMFGNTDASQTRNPSMPCTFNRPSTTDVLGSGPILAVQQGWNTVLQRWRKSFTISLSVIFSSGVSGGAAAVSGEASNAPPPPSPRCSPRPSPSQRGT